MRSIHPGLVFAERATGLAVVCSRPTHDAAWAGRARCGCSRALLRTGSFPFALRATPHPIAYRCRSVCADAHAPARPHARRCGFLRHAHAHAWPRARQRRASRPQCSRKHSRAQVWTLAASQPGVTGRPICNHCNGHDRGSTARLRQRVPKRTRVGGLGRHERSYARRIRTASPVGPGPHSAATRSASHPVTLAQPYLHTRPRAHAAQRLAWPRRGRGRVWRHTRAEPNNLILKATRAGAHRSTSALSRRR
jgi:hypothetical protein